MYYQNAHLNLFFEVFDKRIKASLCKIVEAWNYLMNFEDYIMSKTLLATTLQLSTQNTDKYVCNKDYFNTLNKTGRDQFQAYFWWEGTIVPILRRFGARVDEGARVYNVIYSCTFAYSGTL